MREILDTKVFVSGVFFSGRPNEILRAWADGKLQLLISPDILDEYRRVGRELRKRHGAVDLEPILALVAVEADLVEAPDLDATVREDPDDDKFLACALAGKCRTVVSGDRHLLKVSGYGGIRVLRPREFLSDYLKKK